MACNQEEPMSEGGASQVQDTDPEQTVSLEKSLTPAIKAPASSPASNPSDNGKELAGCSINANASSSGPTAHKETVDYFLKKPASPSHIATPSNSSQTNKQKKDKYWGSKSASNGSSNGNGSNGEHSDDMALSVTGSTNGSSNGKSGSGTEQPMEVENSENGERGSNTLSNYGSSETSDSKSATLSMLSGSSNDDQPSTSGCSSEQSVKAKNREKLFAAIQELKSMLPASGLNDGKDGKPSTLAALTHAIECVKKISSSNAFDLPFPEEEEDPSAKDNSIPTYSLHSLCTLSKNVVLQNMESFLVVVSVVDGTVLHASDMIEKLLGYTPKNWQGRKFATFLARKDVPTFYSHMASMSRSGLPTCTRDGDTGALSEGKKNSSFYCFIRHDTKPAAASDPPAQVNFTPFRLTGRKIRVVMPPKDNEGEGKSALCCLALAVPVKSAYKEDGEVPVEKRTFLSCHTPSCNFSDVDSRAVPLTGYLPQDLIGRCIFDFINQDDAPIMLSVHEKVVKTPMGQTFNEGPVRFLVRNGNEVTIETSWSSFINPWTRKIDFVIGQHRVTRGPQEIDVFRNPIKAWIGHPDIRKDIAAMEQAICKLLLQTTIPQLATPDHHLVHPVENPDQFAEDAVDVQEKCMDMHILKARGQQIFVEKVKKMADKPGKEAEDAKGTSSSSNVYSPSNPAALPNYEQLNYAQNIHRYLLSCPDVFSNSSMEEDQQQEQDLNTAMDAVQQAAELPRGAEVSNLLPEEGLPSQTGVMTTLETSTRSVAVTTSGAVMTMAPMSQDSHVPLDPAHSEDIPIVDDFSDKNETNSEVGEPLPPPSSYQKVGLTQEILSQHTINQERTYVEQTLKEGYNHLLLPHFQRRHGHKRQLLTPENETVTNKLSKHCQISNGIPRHRASMSNSSSVAPQTTMVDAQTAQNMFVPIHNPSQNQSMPMGQMQVPVFPNQMGMNLSMFGMPFGMPVPQFMQGGMPPTGQPMMGSVPMMPMAQNFMYSGFFPHYGFSSAGGFTVPTTPSTQIPQGSSIWTQVPQRPLFHQGGGMQPLHINTDPGTFGPTMQMETPLSHVSAQCLNPTPVVAPCSTSAEPAPTAVVPPPAPTTGISERVGSQCSSPLQLNLMQQELQEGGSRQTAAQAGSTCHQSPHRKLQTDQEGLAPVKKVCKTTQVKDKEDDNSLDTSSMLDLLLAESNDGNSSTPDLGSDPSFTSSEGSNTQEQKRKMESRERENFKRYVLQDPIWRVMANTTQKVMMTYQLPRREIDDVLKQDQDKLRSMERNQPAFSSEQMGELGDVKMCRGKMKMPDMAACDEALDKCLSKKRKRMPSRKHLSVQTVISPTMESVLESNLPSSSCSSQKSETEMANLPGDIGRSAAKDSSDNWGDNSNGSNGRSSRSSSSIKESDDKSQSNNSKDSDEYPVEKRLPPKRHSSPTTSNSSSDL
uniref:Period circadian protein n=1 Tax=Branchiostoma lanceolatum TaxID=7740 RepID=A9YX69_BRALA|nr:period [Branchiostoma lanceolatum]